MKDVSIIIVNYNSGPLTKQCIKSVQNSGLKLACEIIVVDNSSADDSVEMLKSEFSDNKDIKIIENKENNGFASGVNIGIKTSNSRYILILNPDITIIDDAITALYNFMEKQPECGIASPKLLNPNGTVQNSCFRFVTPFIILYRRTFLGKLPFGKKALHYFLMKDFDHNSVRNVAWVLGSSLFACKKAIDKVGLMDERFFMYFEDVDWCRRFHENGYKVYYYPEAKMAHYLKRSTAQRGIFGEVLFNKIAREHIKSAIKYFLKYFGKEKPEIKNQNL